jgi:hypothetical protein
VDRLVVRATNVATATVDAARARLSCAPQLDIQSDGPLDLRLDCTTPLRTATCGRTVSVPLPRVRGRRVVLVTVTRRGNRMKRVRGRNLRRVVVPRVSRGPFSLRIYLRTSRRGTQAGRRVVLHRRIAACRRIP